jgi:type I restriction enzyme S subunit
MNFESLSDLTTYLQRGISPKYAESGIPVVNQKCIRNGQLKNEDIKFHGNEKTYAQEKELRKDDILVNSTGVGTLGRVARFSNEIGKMLADSHVTIVRADVEKIDPLYLFYVLRFNEPTIVELGAGSTGQTELSRLALGSLQIPIPNRSVQRFVADTLSNIDKKILTNQRLAKVLEEIAQAIFKSWFIDFDPVKAKMAGEKPSGVDAATAALFPDSMRESELGLIPQGWNVRSIGDSVIKQKVGKLFDSKTSFPSGSVPVLDQGKSGVVGFHDEEPGVFASPEAPLVVFANHTCLLRLVSYPFSVIQNVFPLTGNKVDVIWLYFAVEGKQQFDSYKGHWPDFVLHKIIHPTVEATRAFRMIVEPLLKEKWLLEQQSKILGNIRDSLLPRLISGELQIPEEMLAS